MKIGWSKGEKEKKVEIDADVERIAEKAMDLHEKDWKDKFVTRHNAKKEILGITHKQKVEMEEVNKNKKNYIQRILEEKRLSKELELKYEKELEEAKRQEKYKEKKLKLIITAILGIMIIIFVILGAILGNNVDSFLYIITLFAFLLVIPIVSIWKSKDD